MERGFESWEDEEIYSFCCDLFLGAGAGVGSGMVVYETCWPEDYWDRDVSCGWIW